MGQIENNTKKRFISVLLFWICLPVSFIPIILMSFGYPGYQMERNGVDITPANPILPYASIIVILVYAFWLYSVHKLHREIREIIAVDHPISPNKAAFFHLIPFWNYYWVFKWTKEIACTVNKKYSQEMSKWLYGTFLLLSMIIWTFIVLAFPRGGLNGFPEVGSINLAITSIVGIAISRRVRRIYIDAST